MHSLLQYLKCIWYQNQVSLASRSVQRISLSKGLVLISYGVDQYLLPLVCSLAATLISLSKGWVVGYWSAMEHFSDFLLDFVHSLQSLNLLLSFWMCSGCQINNDTLRSTSNTGPCYLFNQGLKSGNQYKMAPNTWKVEMDLNYLYSYLPYCLPFFF